MSFPYPRRVKDLPTCPSDSDDENSNACEIDKFANKENEREPRTGNIMDSGAKNNSAFRYLRMYPKRRSELPPLESDDSDEEDNCKNDNLNCAILNDSFIMSPGRSGTDENSLLLRTPCDSAQTKWAEANLSFVSRFDKMGLDAEHNDNKSLSKKDEKPPIIETPAAASTARKPTISRLAPCALQSIEEDKVAVGGGSATLQRFNSDPTPQQHSKHKELVTPLKPSEVGAENIEAQFATPQIRSFSVQRRPQDLCSTQSQKTRSAIVNEFRSQKVLFQTPMAITRAPVTCLPNDSIQLSLCDTINEAGNTPHTAEKTPQCGQQQQQQQPHQQANMKSKKSLEGEFSETEIQPKNGKQSQLSNSAATETVDGNAASSTKENILHINQTDYTIVKKLGCGGSSSVYLARRNHNGKEYAVKVVDLHGGDPVVVKGYLNETKLLVKLQGNICVVALYEYQLLQKESKLLLVMEKGDSDLQKILQTYTTSLPLYVLMNFWYQMLQAVNYIHQNGVIHSDLKPANFLMINGRLKLIDFGIASNIAIDSTSIIKFSQAGTFNYISPEALTDTSTGTSPMRSNQPKVKISTKSDVWSLGCILYLLLYKKTPFSHIKNICAKISAISSPTHVIEYPAIPLYYPAMLVHMVKNCLQHNPKKRPSCAELLQYPFNMVIPIQNLAIPPK